MPNTMTVLLRCPHCKNSMKYLGRSPGRSEILANKRKKCVYCGKSYPISLNIIQKL